MPSGQILGYLVSARGIEANPEKIRDLLQMPKPTKLCEVQGIAGRVAALSRFISRMGEKALPFYQVMKKANKFEWTNKARLEFEKLKRMLTNPQVLVAPREQETLYLCIVATNRVVSTLLVGGIITL